MFKGLFERLDFGNTLYYPGCLTHYVLPEIEKNYETLLRQVGVDFIVLPEFNCCGSPVKNAGYEEDFNILCDKTLSILKKYSVSRIITNCPACYRVLSDMGLKVEHVTQTLNRRIDRLKAKKSGKITYHDPCHLGRHSGIYNEPRNILKKVGFGVVELDNCRENGLCCGGGAGVKTNYPEMSDRIAKDLLSRVKTERLVTPCPLCYKHLKDNSTNIEVLEFSEVLM
ncbi:MAG: (Fe-S)-binding protein [Candidatus Altiarchaeota archaeon]